MKASFHRAVVDTGVLLSRIIRPDSTPARAFESALHCGALLVSDATLEELKAVLLRPKFDPYLPLALRLRFLEDLVGSVEHVTILERVTECRDPRDNKFLEVALNGEAGVLITGDNDLLVLHPWRGIEILSPAQYLDALR